MDDDPRGRCSGTGALAVVAIAVLALAIGLGAGTGAAAGAPAGVVATDPCNSVAENGSAVVVTPPTDEPTGPDGTVAVYRGSELVVHLCQPENGTQRLDAAGVDWATVVEDAPDRVRLRIEGPTNATLGSLASPEPVPGPGLAIVDRTVDSTLVNGSIPVASAEQRASLRDAEATYLERERALEAQLGSLATATATVENGSTPAGDPVAETIAAWAAYRNASESLRSELYAVADSPVGGPASAAAIQALGERSATFREQTTARLAAYDAALRDRERSATRSLRLRIVGLGLLGALVGGAAGVILPIRRGRTARRRLAQGEWAAYDRRTVLLPVVLGMLLVCAGIAVLAIVAGDALLEVTLP